MPDKKHCCLIGGLGFIGKNLITELSKSQRKITTIDIKREDDTNFPPNIKKVQGDYTKKAFLEEILTGVDEVVYLAYATNPQTSYDDPINDIIGNLPGSITLFETAVKSKVKKLIYISSGGTVYGDVTEIPIRENIQTNPISPYGITKLTIEKYGLMYLRLKGLPIVILRPSNAYGIGQKPFTGQGFIATAVGSILQKKEIKLYGEKGTIRDYIYVTDLARAIVSALDYGRIGSIYNVGSGIGRSNRDVLDCITQFALADGYTLKMKVMPERDFDVKVNVLDSTRFLHDTNWQINVPFDEGIKMTWNWMKNEINNY